MLGPVSTPYSDASSRTLHHTVDTWWCSGCHHTSPGWKTHTENNVNACMVIMWCAFEKHAYLWRVCICLPWHIGIHGEYAVQEDNDAQYRGRDEELSINTQPGKIQPNLLSKVLPVRIKAIYQRAVWICKFKDFCIVRQSVDWLVCLWSRVNNSLLSSATIISELCLKLHFSPW